MDSETIEGVEGAAQDRRTDPRIFRVTGQRDAREKERNRKRNPNERELFKGKINE